MFLQFLRITAGPKVVKLKYVWAIIVFYLN